LNPVSHLSGIIRGAEKAFRADEFVGGAGEVSHLAALLISAAAEVIALVSLRVAESPAAGFDAPLPRPAENTDYTLCYPQGF